MPPTVTPRVLALAEELGEELKKRGCMAVREIESTYGLTHTQAYHVVRLLDSMKRCVKYRLGGVLMVCAPDSVPSRIFVAGQYVDMDKIKKFICKLAQNSSGRTISISTMLLIEELYRDDVARIPRFIDSLRAFYEHVVHKTLEECFMMKWKKKYVYRRECVVNKCRLSQQE